MENHELTNHTEKKLKINSSIETFLTEIRKWAFFLSIIGFVFIGLMVVASIIMSAAFSLIPQYDSPLPFPLALFGGIYIILALVYFFPVYYLYQFSVKMKHALLNHDEDFLTTSFGFLKSHYKFIGILTIVMLILYPLFIVAAVLVGVMGNL